MKGLGHRSRTLASAATKVSSEVLRELAEGAAGLAFEPRGRYRLKGLEREHDLFAAASAADEERADGGTFSDEWALVNIALSHCCILGSCAGSADMGGQP